jgi:threonylcarbamoyladenosine tRNA methylthiotransferase MtaB
MQSGSDAVLRRMRRRWGARRFVDRCLWVREQLERPALTTDVIVGFPGESDDDFAATCRVCAEVGFSKIHIFPFSARRATPAATMADQVPPEVKAERVRRLTALEAELRARYFASLVGRKLRVIVEGPSPARPGHVLGTSCRYAPVEFAGQPELRGEMLDVFVRSSAGDRLVGELAGRLC